MIAQILRVPQLVRIRRVGLCVRECVHACQPVLTHDSEQQTDE